MSDRINTPFTNEHFADWCQKMVGQPYWYGTCVYKATNSLLSRKSNQYPSSYASSRMSRYKQDVANKAVVSDCIGGCKGYAWTNGGQGVLEAIGTDKAITSKYGSNGCPDKGANSMFSWAKKKGMDWGTISARRIKVQRPPSSVSAFFNPSGTILSRTRRPAALLPEARAVPGPSVRRSPADPHPGLLR